MKKNRHDHRTPSRRKAAADGFLRKLFAKPKRLPATATQEHDWETDLPSIKLSTAFMVILFLHVAVVGGVMLFRFLERSSQGAVTSVAGEEPAPAVAQAPAGDGIRLDDPALAGLKRHRVRPHESLDMIARTHGITRDALSRANRLSEQNPFTVGMVLVIPPPEVAEPAAMAGESADDAMPVAVARPVNEPANPEAGASLAVDRPAPVSNHGATMATGRGERTHVVKPGDTLWGLSRRYNVSVQAIMKANNLSDAKKVRDGASLRIPAAQ